MSTKLSSWALLSGFCLMGSLSATALAAEQDDAGPAQTAERSGRAANDASLATDLKSRLADRVPDAANIRVEADRGVVTLSGTVGSKAAQRRAMSIARQTPGVTRVDDELNVQSNL